MYKCLCFVDSGVCEENPTNFAHPIVHLAPVSLWMILFVFTYIYIARQIAEPMGRYHWLWSKAAYSVEYGRLEGMPCCNEEHHLDKK